MTWSAFLDVADDVIVVLGILFLIVRQFLWRDARAHRLLRLPVIVIDLGIVLVVWNVIQGEVFTDLDALMLFAELVLVAATGSIMGRSTVFRRVQGLLQYKLNRWAIALWALFIAIRVGSFLLAAHLGAHVLETSGAILISFGGNRLASSLVVLRRASDQQQDRPVEAGARQ